MICPNGHVVESGASFCQSCGAYVGQPVTTNVAPLEATHSSSLPVKKMVIGGAALIVVVVAVLIVVKVAGASHKTVQLTEQVYGSNCTSATASVGLQNGTFVSITGDSGSRIGTSALGSGTDSTMSGGRSECTYKAKISVPTNQSTYTLHVGSLNSLSFTKAQLTSNGWAMDAYVGASSSSSSSSGYSSGYSSGSSSSSSSGF